MCNTYGITRATLYRWIKRFDPKDIRSVKDKTRRLRMDKQGIKPFGQTHDARWYKIPKAWVKVKKPAKLRGKPIYEIVETRMREFPTLLTKLASIFTVKEDDSVSPLSLVPLIQKLSLFTETLLYQVLFIILDVNNKPRIEFSLRHENLFRFPTGTFLSRFGKTRKRTFRVTCFWIITVSYITYFVFHSRFLFVFLKIALVYCLRMA